MLRRAFAAAAFLFAGCADAAFSSTRLRRVDCRDCGVRVSVPTAALRPVAVGLEPSYSQKGIRGIQMRATRSVSESTSNCNGPPPFFGIVTIVSVTRPSVLWSIFAVG